MDSMNAQTKVPFYMTYPMQNLYLMEMEYEKDMERMRELYPQEVRKLMPYVEDFCDGLEYEGSRIYDENPDTRMMREYCKKLIAQIRGKQNTTYEGDHPKTEKTLTAASVDKGEGVRSSAFALNPPEGWELPPDRGRILSAETKISAEGTDHGTMRPTEDTPVPDIPSIEELQDLIGILFADEIYRRRCRHRRCRRWW